MSDEGPGRAERQWSDETLSLRDRVVTRQRRPRAVPVVRGEPTTRRRLKKLINSKFAERK